MIFYKLDCFDADNPLAITSSIVNFEYEDMTEVIKRELECEVSDAVTVTIGNGEYVLIVDDEGAVGNDVPKHEVNIPAWFFYSNWDEEQVIYGNALLGKLGEVNGEKDVVGLDNDDIFEIAKAMEALAAASSTIDPSRLNKM